MKRTATVLLRGMATSLGAATALMLISCGWWYYRWTSAETLMAYGIVWVAIMAVRAINRIAFVIRMERQERDELLPYGIRRMR